MEEEKKAIEDFKKFMNKYEAFVFYSKQKGDTAEVNPHIRMYESYKNVLNLIEKQDKMIDLILASWKQDDVRSIEELKEYFRKRVEEDAKN